MQLTSRAVESSGEMSSVSSNSFSLFCGSTKYHVNNGGVFSYDMYKSEQETIELYLSKQETVLTAADM